MITPYPDVANSGAFFFSFLGWYCTGNAAISWCGHHFSYCWSCKVPLVHGSYTFAMFRWCSPLSQWCLSCLITIRYSVIWCYLMLFGYSLVIKHGLLENPYRFFFSGNIIYSTWVLARGYMGCTWNCGRSLARFVQAFEILDQQCTSQNSSDEQNLVCFFFSVAQSHSFSWNFRPKNPNFPTKTLFPSPPTAPPMWGARSCARGCRGSRSWRSFGRRGGCCGSSWEARRPWSSAALGHGTGESPNPPSPGFEDLEHYPLVIADIAIEHGYL